MLQDDGLIRNNRGHENLSIFYGALTESRSLFYDLPTSDWLLRMAAKLSFRWNAPRLRSVTVNTKEHFGVFLRSGGPSSIPETLSCKLKQPSTPGLDR